MEKINRRHSIKLYLCDSFLTLGRGLLAEGRPQQIWLGLVIPYSGNPKKIFETEFSVGVIPINKYPLFAPFGGFLAWEFPYIKELVCLFDC